jgi:CRP-like cAMP-binding protein
MATNEIFKTIGRHDLSASEKLVVLILSKDGSEQLTQDEIAKLAGTTRITVARSLRSLRLRGELPYQLAMAATAGR